MTKGIRKRFFAMLCAVILACTSVILPVVPRVFASTVEEQMKQETEQQAAPAAEENKEEAAPVQPAAEVKAEEPAKEEAAPQAAAQEEVKTEQAAEEVKAEEKPAQEVQQVQEPAPAAPKASNVKMYTITWTDDDGTVLAVEEVEKGTLPVYPNGTPEKAEDAQYTYEFKAWSPTVRTASANKTYKATYTKTAKRYNVTVRFTGIRTTDGQVIEKTQTQSVAANSSWTFTQKKLDNMIPSKNFTYDGITYKYTGTWKNADGTVFTSCTVKGAELTGDTELVFTAVYEETGIWYLDFRYTDNISTGSGSWSNQGAFSSYKHTFKAPEAAAHYQFVKWFNTDDNTDIQAGETYTYPAEYMVPGMRKDIRINAVWQPSVTVVYHWAGNENGSEVEKYEDIDVTAQGAGYDHNGLTFLGWYDAQGTQVESVSLPGTTTQKVERKVVHVYARYAASMEAKDAQKIYGEEDPALEAELNGFGSDEVSYELTREAGEQAGEYAILLSVKEAPAYPDGAQKYEISVKNAVFTIEAKEITVTVQDAVKTEGEADPEFKAEVEGLVGEDSIEYAIVRKAGEAAGTYALTAQGETEQGSYIVTYIEGTLTIKAAPVIPQEDTVIPARPEAPKTEEPAVEAEEETIKNVSIEEVSVPLAAKADKVEVIIENAPVAQAAPQRFWALINLLSVIATAAASLMMLVLYFAGKDRDEENEDGEEEKEQIRRKGLVRLLSLIPAAGAVIAFALTEDMSVKMALVDKWTVLMLVIFAVNIALAILSVKKHVKEENADEA